MRYYKQLNEDGTLKCIGTGGRQGETISEAEYTEILNGLPEPTPIVDDTPTTDERLEALEAAMLDMIMGGST